MDDLCVRFIINLPQEDLSSVPRICFQVEEAQWFYEDFIRPLDPTLPSMSLRTFCLRIFQHCPLLTTFPVGVHIQAFEEFLQYKTRVPVRGAILLNDAMDSVLLVRGWKKGANWSFPRGKINKDEDDLDCAIREVYEETGFDIRAAGLVPPNESVKFIEVTMRDQQIRLYVFRNVPMDTHFQPRTRKEISKIQWYKLSDLPAFRKKGNHNHHSNQANNANNANKFYMVAPFLVPLKKWVVQQHKKDAAKARKEAHLMPEPVPEETATEDETWNQPQPGQEGPNQDALEGATRELQRLLRMQPPTQGIQLPSQSSSDQDKGGALLALLQSKTPVANPHPQAPVEVNNTESEQSRPVQHQQHAHHPPPVPENRPPPSYPSGNPGPWTTNQHSNVSQPFHNQYPNTPPQQRAPHPPALLHPQPLPPQVQKTGVFDYTTPPPHALQNASGVPQGNYQQGPQPEYPGRQQGRSHVGPLNEHSKALLDVLRSVPSPNNTQNPVELPTDQPQHRNNSRAPQAPSSQGQVPDIAAAAQPYQQADMSLKFPMNQAQPLVQPQGQSDKHRSALLDIFKQNEPRAPLKEAPLPTAAGSSVPGSKGSSRAGGSPHGLLANLSIQGQSGSPSSQPYHSPGQYGEIGPPKAQGAGTGSSQTLLQLLRRQGEAPEPQRQPVPHSAAYDPANAAPTAYGSPPAAASFPAPVFHRGREAPPEHKQKLLSLFSQQQQQQPELPATGGSVEAGNGKGVGSGIELHGTSASGPGSAEGERNGSGGPISPADRSFLLGYLQSATHGR